MSMFEEQTLLTRNQAASMLGCSVDTIDRLCSDGTLRKRNLRDFVHPVTGRTHTSVPRIYKPDVEALIEKKFGVRRVQK